MSSNLITVNLSCLIEKKRTFTITIDSDYTVLDFIMYLKNYDSKLGSYSLTLPKSDLISPANLQDKILPQVNNLELNIKIYTPFTYRNSFNFIDNLIGLHENNLLKTTNLMDVDYINQAKFGEWIGFGRGPITVPLEENNRLGNLLWIIYNNDEPVCYNMYALSKLCTTNGGKLLIPHLNKKFQSDSFYSACNTNNPFRILRLNGNDIIFDE